MGTVTTHLPGDPEATWSQDRLWNGRDGSPGQFPRVSGSFSRSSGPCAPALGFLTPSVPAPIRTPSQTPRKTCSKPQKAKRMLSHFP